LSPTLPPLAAALPLNSTTPISTSAQTARAAFGLQSTPFHINAAGNFDRLSIGDEGEHVFNGDGTFSLANGNFTTDPSGNLTARSFTTAGDIEITDIATGVILKSPGGTRYRIKVADDGTLSTEAAP
jgi:hypothetical protein